MRLCKLLLVALFLLVLPLPVSATTANMRQDDELDPEVARILDQLTPEERVGQLFVVSFDGTNTDENSGIYRLITRYHIGGVTLSSQNGNITDLEPAPDSVAQVARSLQELNFSTFIEDTDEVVNVPLPDEGRFPPLLVAMTVFDENNVMQVQTGVTDIPTPLSLGATWDPTNAQLVGEIVGAEFAEMGINMMLGPSLDVLAAPRPGNTGDLGVATFGGNAYWVSQMANAYIEGVHTGSNNSVAVIANRFPGIGDGDRDETQALTTVNKTLEALQDVDLYPFQQATSLDAGLATLDGVQTSSARYVALQGTTSSDTKPFGFDSQALGSLLAEPEFAEWHAGNNVVVSSSLGANSVRSFYDPTGEGFPAFVIARDALLAGNDLLLLDNFGLEPEVDQVDTVIATIEAFVQKYEEDPAFATRVDQAVAKIIGFKLDLFDSDFSLENIVGPSPAEGEELPPLEIEVRNQEMFAIAQSAASLIHPSADELADRLPRPPSADERIVFLTDTLTSTQCLECGSKFELSANAIEQAALRLYGINGTGQINSNNLLSYSFQELDGFLNGIADEQAQQADVDKPQVGDAIANADWLVIGLRGASDVETSKSVFQEFLAERPDLVNGKKVVVFAFDVPYLFDASEITQVTAYYGLYSTIPPFVEVSARLLFQELSPTGAPPVSIPAVSYDLETRLLPQEGQMFTIMRDDAALEVAPTEAPEDSDDVAADATASAPELATGNVLEIVTSELLDYNNNVVQDGTEVEFIVTYISDGNITEIFATNTTVDGVARATLPVNRVGVIEIQARSGSVFSQQLQFNVPDPTEGSGGITEVPAGQTVTPVLPTQTSTPVPEPTATATQAPEPTALPAANDPVNSPPVAVGLDLSDLFSAFFALVTIGGVGFWWSNSRGQAISGGVKLVLLVAIGVWLSYNYYAVSGPGVSSLSSIAGIAPTLLSWGGGLIGLGLGWLLFVWRSEE